MAAEAERPNSVPVEELIDLASVRADGRPATPAQIRAALPRGWVLEADGRTARRDVRLFFREGWILMVGLVVFGGAGLGLFWWSFPTGWSGLLRFVLLVGTMVLLGGFIAPRITRALMRK